MERHQIYKTKFDLEPLFRKGDMVKIVYLNVNPDLLPIEAFHFKSGWVYGFYLDELEEKNEN